jgi:ribulose-5-phosphate 4-epimerase/fuculose-1-phosphate aldolase
VKSNVQSIYANDGEPSGGFAERRLHVKQRLAGAYRIFAQRGLDFSILGHITARDPEHADWFWIAPAGIWFGEVTVSDLLAVNHQGEIVEGGGKFNLAGFLIHSEIHKARPDVHAVAHAHSLYGKAWASQGRLLDPISSDACHFYEKHALFDDFTGVVLEQSEGVRIAQALGDKRAVILQNHGILTVGGSVESATATYVAFENACQTQLLAEAAGPVKLISHEVARATANLPRGSDPGFHAFHPLWRKLITEQPDLLG